jgi:hypothetical protein
MLLVQSAQSLVNFSLRSRKVSEASLCASHMHRVELNVAVVAT